MRTAFVKSLEELAAKNTFFLVNGDLGFSVLENLKENHPDKYLNVGVAEANMIGVSSGLALSGKTVFVYSIVPFATMRCFEQIRDDICYQNLDVKIVGVGGGLTYGQLGPTHHSIEDIAIMRSLPNMTVVCPGDPVEAGLATKSIFHHKGPVYLRIGKRGEPVIHKEDINFEIGKAITVNDGDDVTIISTGNMLKTSLMTCKILQGYGLSTRLLSMHTVKPIDTEAVLKASRETGTIFTIEEHSIIGGLGSAVSEIVSESDTKTVFRRIGIPDSFASVVGSHEYLRYIYSLTPEKISEKIQDVIKRNF